MFKNKTKDRLLALYARESPDRLGLKLRRDFKRFSKNYKPPIIDHRLLQTTRKAYEDDSSEELHRPTFLFG